MTERRRTQWEDKKSRWINIKKKCLKKGTNLDAIRRDKLISDRGTWKKSHQEDTASSLTI